MDGEQKHRMNDRSLANLRPAWEPGKSANPKGCPKGAKFDLAKRVEKYLRRVKLADDAGEMQPTGRLFVRTMIREAVKGNPKWGKILVDVLTPRIANQVTINNVLSHATANQLIDESRLTAPIESRVEPPLLDEPQPTLPTPEPKE